MSAQFQLKISPAAKYILKTLENNGFEAYLVGGAVRDLLRQATGDEIGSFDYDFATNATPEEILKIFKESFYENDFGTVMITHEDLCSQANLDPQLNFKTKKNFEKNIGVIDLANASKIHESLELAETNNSLEPEINLPNYEITTYRSKELYEDFRKPKSLEWGKSIQEDLARRDFTINAIALKLNDYKTELSQDYKLIDPFDGLTDLSAKVLRAVGEPEIRFSEDALRMLRAIRFSVQLNFQLEDKTFAAIKKQADLIEKISKERIRDEFLKMLKSNFPAEAVELMEEVGLLKFILPELLHAKKVEQGGHHNTDVWTHSLDALRYCPSTDPIVRLATLLHDIAKPQTQGKNKGEITFYNHEVIGARVAKNIAKRLKLSKQQQERIFVLVRFHMFYYQPFMTDAAIRRMMRKIGLNNIDDILDLREGDRLGSGARKTSWRLEELKERMIQQLNQPMEAKDLAINGHDLMNELGLTPGPILGKILIELLEKVLDNPQLNNKASLLEVAQNILKKSA